MDSKKRNRKINFCFLLYKLFYFSSVLYITAPFSYSTVNLYVPISSLSPDIILNSILYSFPVTSDIDINVALYTPAPVLPATTTSLPSILITFSLAVFSTAF